MCAAAQTAPKGHGLDTIVTYILTDEEKDIIWATGGALVPEMVRRQFYQTHLI